MGRWPDLGIHYEREVEVWVAQRVAFAAVVSVSDYTSVAVAYQMLVDLPGVSKPGRAFTADERTMLGNVRRVIDHGYEVAADRTAPRYQKRSARNRLLRRTERLAAPDT